MRRSFSAFLFLVSCGAAAQPPDTFDFRARDEAHIASLAGEKGASATAGRVAAYVPAGTMSSAELHALAESLNRGVDALIAFTHSPRSWQRIPQKITFYFHTELYLSHADPFNDRLFVAYPRLANGQAPLLHEATHVLLFPTKEFLEAHPELLDPKTVGSTWLGEGVATFVGDSVAHQTGIKEGDPLGDGGLDGADSKCVAGLASPIGAEVLPFIGAPGEPEALSSRARRLEVAPTFYACGTSFTKFLVGKVGIDAIVDAYAALDSEAAIAKAAGTSIGALRGDWRKAIGAN